MRQKALRCIVFLILILALVSIIPMNSAIVLAASPAMSLSLTSGPVGSVVSVIGSGFAASETGITITFDGVALISGIGANSSGNWHGTFTVPTSTYGYHNVGAFGSVTPASSVPVISFYVVNPTISISQTSGTIGTVVTVTGSGFGAGESGIAITFDDNPITSGITANYLGNWSGTFVVPTTTRGSHTISAYGYISTFGFVPSLNFTVTNPAITLSQASGTRGTLVTVTGSGFGASETGITITFDNAPVTYAITSNSQGGWTGTFTVPASVGGSHTISAYGTVTPIGYVAGVIFTAIPAVTLSQTNGQPGASITVNGSGFVANETGIVVTYDGNSVVSGITANSQGSWTGTITVPASVGGSHTISAYGSVTVVSSLATTTFTAIPAITISQSSGLPGTAVTVNGYGFGANEIRITITFDGNSVASGITANSQGSWTSTITVPALVGGSHAISAYGSNTLASSVAGVTFTLSPSIILSQASGSPGSVITVTGSAFGINENGITITYDGSAVGSGIKADSQGSWMGTFTIPTSASGSHTVRAYGITTPTGSVVAVNFKITPSISLDPAAGYVGKTVAINGFGFAANSPLTVTYDTQQIPSVGVSTDANGSFVLSFTAPKSSGGNQIINVTDYQKNSAKATFIMDTNPPPAPNLLSPKDGARLGILGNVTPTFMWSNVNDPSGVTYTLEVDTSSDFSNPVLTETGITANHYTATSAEALPKGQYYWRVKAIDGASNESSWSAVQLLKSGLMMLWTLVLIIVIVIAALVLGAYFGLFRPRALRQKTIVVRGIEEPQTVTGEWRTIEPEQASKERQLPWRLALPEVTKRTKTISTEDQARLKVIIDFAQSLPLVEPDYNANWLIGLIESEIGAQMSASSYAQLFQGELKLGYNPAWLRHPAFQDLTVLLQRQAILQDLNTFVSDVNHCFTEAISMIQDIYHDAVAELPKDFLEKGGWGFITAVYVDAVSWFAGKSLRDPSERDYTLKHADGGADTEESWLCGEDSTSFAGELILVTESAEASGLRNLHIRLRRKWRSNEKAREVAAMITQIQLQRDRLLSVFSRFGQLKG